MTKTLLTQRYSVVVHGEGDQLEQQTYTDILSSDGKTICTYRPNGTLCLRKEFNQKGQYVITRYDFKGEKEEYRVIGGDPDKRTADLFHKGTLTVPFGRHHTQTIQKQRGE